MQLNMSDRERAQLARRFIDTGRPPAYFPRLTRQGSSLEPVIMKIANSLKSLKKRDKNCRIVRRKPHPEALLLGQLLPLEGLALGDDLPHPRFDALEIVIGEVGPARKLEVDPDAPLHERITWVCDVPARSLEAKRSPLRRMHGPGAPAVA